MDGRARNDLRGFLSAKYLFKGETASLWVTEKVNEKENRITAMSADVSQWVRIMQVASICPLHACDRQYSSG